ncbi:MAG: cytochrome b/b6 domain-containing protein, partial [Proteobacteria bacterium]|nr:cytochrome b/b6 domain-containing protein [Pseudomonadota bacterium]
MKHTTAAVIQDTGEARQRRKRYMLWSFLLLIAMTLVLPLIPYAVAYVQDGSAVRNPGSELWREVRQRDQAVIGQTQADNVDAGILINKRGEEWRLFRMKKLIPFGAILIGGILGLIILFYLIRGTLRLPGGRSGKRILRFTLNERIVHWFTVVIFWILALSGLITLYGRYVLVPLLGPEGFSVTASASLMAHNTLGPIFLVAILALFFTFVKNNFFARGDLKWLSKAGGLLGGHASAGRFNAGEKIWFWLAVILGLALCVSGLILDFPNWG